MTEDVRHVSPASRQSPAVEIVHLTLATLQALADGNLAGANETSPIALSPYFAEPDARAVWAIRSGQVAADPSTAAWVTGVIRDAVHSQAVGRAGYHAPPDADGVVEIGYEVDPAYRRRGYARAAFEALLERADREPDVRTVRVTIAPDNEPSLNLVSQYDFIEVGEQWDEEDGREIVFERPAQR